MKEPLDKNLRIRLNASEDRAVIQLAGSRGEKTRSRLVRKMIRDSIAEGPDLLKDDLKTMQEGFRQVAAIGRNINQLAKAAHSGDRVQVDPVLLRAAAVEMEHLRTELAAVIMRSRNRWVRHG